MKLAVAMAIAYIPFLYWVILEVKEDINRNKDPRNEIKKR